MEAASASPAPVSWAQRKDRLYITINVEDCVNVRVTFKEQQIRFSAFSVCGQHEYSIDMDLYDKINVSESRYAIISRNVPMVVKKLRSGPYWPRLLQSAAKVHWLKTDFHKWRDEDDSDDDEESRKHDAEFEDMVHMMGNMDTNSGNDYYKPKRKSVC